MWTQSIGVLLWASGSGIDRAPNKLALEIRDIEKDHFEAADGRFYLIAIGRGSACVGQGSAVLAMGSVDADDNEFVPVLI